MSAPQVQSYTYRDGRLVTAMIQTGAEIRPLVVIDPEDREQVERLRESLEGMSFSLWACGAHTCLQQALRSLVTDPKPEEPQGLGAVVEDADGTKWVRNHGYSTSWQAEGQRERRRFEDVAAVRVLSEGWSE